MAARAGVERDAGIDTWCESVWADFQGSRDVIVGLPAEYEIT